MKPELKRKLSLFSILVLECFGDRMWDVLLSFLIDDWLQYDASAASLRYISIFYLIPRGVLIFTMPFLIDILKTTPRLKLLKTVTIIQNIGVGISAGIFIWQIKLAENRAENNEEFDFNSFLIWGSVLILIQTFVNMASKMSGKVVIERDWIVVVAKKNSEENPKLSYKEHLTQLNSSLTFIDMFVTVLSGIPPLVIWDLAGVYFIVYFVAGYNVVCCFVEIFLMYYLASLTPELKKKVANDDENEVDSSSIDSSSTVSGRVDSDSTSEKNPEKDTSYLKNFRIFFNNEFWVMGVSLSMLYFSVIGPSGVTRVYIEQWARINICDGAFRSTDLMKKDRQTDRQIETEFYFFILTENHII